MKSIVILYHADCSDGLGAAWAAWKHFGNEASYISLPNGVPAPTDLKGKEIYLVDYCFSKEITKKLIKDNKRVTAIDHHISNKSTVALTHKPLYRLHNSGAALTWQYFHLKKPLPIYLKYVQDADLWKLKMPHAKEFVATRQFHPENIKNVDNFIKKFENVTFRKKFLNDGKFILKYQKAVLYNILRNVERIRFHGANALVVNSPVFTDELSSMMYKKEPVAIVWHNKKNSIKVSLRSNGLVDVSKIAEKYGGGGHKRAAAFKLDKNIKLPWV
ncbi:MAG: DHHA1 domain-containing protein [bacterium]|nr:DHHA1 domain-containing protein [bacterium]